MRLFHLYHVSSYIRKLISFQLGATHTKNQKEKSGTAEGLLILRTVRAGNTEMIPRRLYLVPVLHIISCSHKKRYYSLRDACVLHTSILLKCINPLYFHKADIVLNTVYSLDCLCQGLYISHFRTTVYFCVRIALNSMSFSLPQYARCGLITISIYCMRLQTVQFNNL